MPEVKVEVLHQAELSIFQSFPAPGQEEWFWLLQQPLPLRVLLPKEWFWLQSVPVPPELVPLREGWSLLQSVPVLQLLLSGQCPMAVLSAEQVPLRRVHPEVEESKLEPLVRVRQHWRHLVVPCPVLLEAGVVPLEEQKVVVAEEHRLVPVVNSLVSSVRVRSVAQLPRVVLVAVAERLRLVELGRLQAKEWLLLWVR